MKTYYVYILSNQNDNVLYVGVTDNLLRRLGEHKTGLSTFTNRYNVHKLIYVETTSNVNDALAREKQIKKWRREKKDALIDTVNPDRLDLSDTWGDTLSF